MKNIVEELRPIYDLAKSFYGKAIVEHEDDTINLYSYGHHVAQAKEGELLIDFNVPQVFSQTSLRHIKEFATQFTNMRYPSINELRACKQL